MQADCMPHSLPELKGRNKKVKNKSRMPAIKEFVHWWRIYKLDAFPHVGYS
jgi:hypothetical protein